VFLVVYFIIDLVRKLLDTPSYKQGADHCCFQFSIIAFKLCKNAVTVKKLKERGNKLLWVTMALKKGDRCFDRREYKCRRVAHWERCFL